MFDAMAIFTMINCTYAYCVDVEVGDDDRLPLELNGISDDQLDRAVKAWRYAVLSKMQTVGREGDRRQGKGGRRERGSKRACSYLRPRETASLGNTGEQQLEKKQKSAPMASGSGCLLLPSYAINPMQLSMCRSSLRKNSAVSDLWYPSSSASDDSYCTMRGASAMSVRVTNEPLQRAVKASVSLRVLKKSDGRAKQRVTKDGRAPPTTAAAAAAASFACARDQMRMSAKPPLRDERHCKEQGRQQLVRSTSWSPCQGGGMRMVHGSRSPELLATAAQAAKVAAIVKGGRCTAVSEEEKARRERAASALRESHKWERGRWENGMGCGRLSILRKTTSV